MAQRTLEKVQILTDSSGNPLGIADVMSRIDAILDELYSLRQIVQGWQTAQEEEIGAPPDRVNDLTSSLPLTMSEPDEAVENAASTSPITDSLFGAAGKGTWDEVYSNAEIVYMQFGEK